MTGILNRYEALVAGGEIRPDPDQRAAAVRLDAIARTLEARGTGEGGFLSRIFGKKTEPVRGLYMWGGVGRGKSMLMDLFYDTLNLSSKRRSHFHEFMLDVHDRLRVARQSEKGDPIPPVVESIAAQARVLCFDEMVVNNMADAAILSRLFAGLLEAGVTVITTSNRVPDDLYKDGLNRQLFLPFIDLLKARLDVITLDGPTDYRLDRLAGARTWLVPNGAEATRELSETFFRLTDYVVDAGHVPSEDVPIHGGRTIHVPKSLKGVAVFSFKRLCSEARGASDYLAIARHFHTIIIVGIPILGPENRNEAARFVTLIDALYEYKVKLLASAEAEPEVLYPSGDGAFEFQRTVSRLMEMRSLDYLALGHGGEE
ncbi:MAG TPA: cell division protein ZapE [Sphingobium sp.]